MKFSEYIIDCIFSVLCLIVTILSIVGLLWIVEVPTIFIMFVVIIICLAFLSYIMWNYHRKKDYYNELLNSLSNLSEKTLLTEIISAPSFLEGKILYSILKQNNKYYNDRISELEKSNKDYQEYIDTWVHEIKTPITSARLIIENEKNVTTLRIDDELRKIDNLVEQVLYYARSTVMEKDFKVEKTTLKNIVNTSIKTYSKLLIQANAHVSMSNIDVPICVDVKSCSFIIGQIISNAIKYRHGTLELKFTSVCENNEIKLIIQDNGIGIATADIPRVFDKGFTGENGRKYPKSTGMGLYLCKKLCKKMNIKLDLESKREHGTKIILHFPKESLLYEAGI